MWQWILEGFELVYYIAFIILTALLAIYAIKTYVLQSEKTYKILCKFSIISTSVGTEAIGYGAEVYNNGNIVAENIEVYYRGQYVTKLDYIKPNESILVPLGNIAQIPSGKNILFPNFGDASAKDEHTIELNISGSKQVFVASTDILFNYKGGSDSFDKIADKLESIDRKLKR